MKLIKKITMFICIFALTLSFTNFSQAKSSDTSNNNKLDAIISDIIQTISIEPEVYGMNNIELDKIELCEPIKPYMIDVNNNLILIDDLEYYPICYNDKIVAEFTVYYDDNKLCNVDFSSEILKGINDFVESENDSNFALVYSNNDLYVINQNNTCKIKSFYYESNANKKISNKRAINIQTIIKSNTINYSAIISTGIINSMNNLCMLKSSTTKRLNVPFKSNPPIGLCWAASTASVGEYRTDISYTAKEVAKKMNMDTEGGNVYDCQDALYDIYDISTNAGPATLSNENIIDLIDIDIPFIAVYGDENNNEAHAVVVCGYSYGSSGMNITVMDPNFSRYKVSSSCMHDGKQTYKTGYASYKLYWKDTCF